VSSFLTAHQHIIDPPESSTQTQSRCFSCFCMAHKCDRQTDRPTNRDQPTDGQAALLGR